MNSIQTKIDPERPPIFIGAGVIKSESAIDRYAAMPGIAAQVIGSFSWDEWGGNDPTRQKTTFYWDAEQQAAYNAIGLQNPGHEAASKYLPGAISRVRAAGQLAIISVTSLKHEDAREVVPDLVEWALGQGAQGVEINGSCPNEGEHSLLCEDTEKTLATLAAVRQRVGDQPYLSLKVSPLAPETIEQYGASGLAVNAVAMINNCRRLSPPRSADAAPVIEVNDGYAGQSGPIINGLARQNLKHWRQATGGQYDHWSIGGVDTGYEVYHRQNSGAVLVGGAQAFYRHKQPEEEVAKWAEQYWQCVANMSRLLNGNS
jgi:dihydroorotate dehydrogenase